MRWDRSQHVDIAGRPIVPGTYVAYATEAGGSPNIRFGRVVELRSHAGYMGRMEAEIAVLGARWGWDGVWTRGKRGGAITISHLDRVLVIPQEAVPPAALALLLEAVPQKKGRKR